jgi:small-conductance mechanosensitive channel
MKIKRVFKSLFLTFIFLLLVTISIPVLEATDNKPFIGEDDIYSKDLDIGSSDNFRWTVYRNSSKTYAVTVKSDGFEKWNQKINPDFFILDDIHPYKIVFLNFSIPNYPEKSERNAKVTFIFREINTSIIYSIEKHVFVKVIGTTSVGDQNTIVGGYQNPLPPPLNTPFGAFLLNILIWLVIAFIVHYLIKKVLMAIVLKTKTKVDDIIIEIIRRPILFLIILYGFIHSLLKFGISIGFSTSLYQFYTFLVVIIGIYVSYRIFLVILNEMTRKRGGKSGLFGTVAKPIFKKIGLIVIIIGGLVYGLSLIGIQITALLAGAGVMGLVIAFAAQDTLSNFFSGMHLLIDRPFKIREIIKLESGEYCKVINIGMRSTKLYNLIDHEYIILPNNSIANQKIINMVKPDKKLRDRIKVGVAYGTDVSKVEKILYESAMKHPNVVKDEEFKPLIRFKDFGDSSLDFSVVFWIDDILNQWKTRSDIRKEIDARFRKEGIKIPFPQRTIWLNQMKNEQEKKKKNK